MENNNSSLYLKDIADQLWHGYASIIVGAGFSKNASDKFLSWNCLAKVIYQNLYHEEPKENDNLKLFQGIEADPNKGKDILYKELNKVIPNTTSPSELHTKLLNLPWKDIFTTNYDTLLERTDTERPYTTIRKEKDLQPSSSPRIIKLHGSLPKGPFIITEQDYLSYKDEYPLFVNTIHQAFIEGTICLVGFSGDDPNFKQCNYWINYNDPSKHKIYFISAGRISRSERNILHSYNILPIDYFCKEKTSPKEAINHFIEYLENSRPEQATSKKEYIKIKPNNSQNKWGENLNINQNPVYKDILTNWETDRKSYPGWLILPAAKREVVFKGMSNISLTDKRFSELSTPDDLFFLYEFNWRTEKCLHPILNDWVPIYETVLQKYDPYKKTIVTSDTTTKETNPSLDWDKIQKTWIALQLSLLRLYREEGWTEKWDNLFNILKEKEDSFTEENKARLNNELCLHYLFIFDFENLVKTIKDWKVDSSFPYWAAKRATLLAEFCSTEDAVPILKQCLIEVRRRLNLIPISNDYSLVSLESYLMFLYRNILPSDKLSHKDFDFKSFPNYVSRWNKLKQYQCDPWGEIENFKSQLFAIPLKLPDRKEIHATFDIGQRQTTYSFGGDCKSPRLSWEYIRFIEETGIPYHLPFIQMLDKKTLGKAIYFVSKSSPLVAIIAMVRSGNKENIEYVYDRKTLPIMDSNTINKQASEYIKLLRSSCLEDHQNQENIFSTLSLILPEILSRFCTKISYDLRKKLIDILKDIYKSRKLNPFAGYDTLMKRLVNSFTEEEQYKLIPEWLEFPIIDPDRKEFDPFNYISYGRLIKHGDKIFIKEEVIDDLLSALKIDDSKRSIAIYKLAILIQYHLLNDSQMDRFGKNLWIDTGKDGFPKQNVFPNFTFIDLPHPENISPVDLLKKHIKATPLGVGGSNSTTDTHHIKISISYGDIIILRNIVGTDYYRDKYQWTREEINILTSNIINWWNTNKDYLTDTRDFMGTSMAQEYKQRLDIINQIITGVIAHNFSKINTKNVTNLKIMIDELPNYGISNLNIKSALDNHYSIAFSDLEKEILSALSSSSEEAISDAISGILTLARKGNDVTRIISTVSDNFRCCKREGLCYCINCLKEILWKDYRQYISKEFIQNIELGLAYLKEYTTINESDDDLIVDDKLLYRQHIASLLPRLVEYYEPKHQDLPPIVSEWVKIVSNQNEFSDIRNAYINAKEDE